MATYVLQPMLHRRRVRLAAALCLAAVVVTCGLAATTGNAAAQGAAGDSTAPAVATAQSDAARDSTSSRTNIQDSSSRDQASASVSGGETSSADAVATPYPGIRDLRRYAANTISTAETVYRWPHLTLAIWIAAGALLLMYVVTRDRIRKREAAALAEAATVSPVGDSEPPPEGVAYLQPLDLPGEPRYYALGAPSTAIGTANDGTCEITIDADYPGADTVSALHATVESSDRARVLVDRDSDAGVFVNGQRVGECLLASDCRVSIGNVRFAYVANNAGTSA